jgi:CBS domain containing-hemolysin-like protein
MGLELPEGDESDTLGGWITERLDRLPAVGDTVRMPAIDHVHRDEDNLPTRAEVILTVAQLDGHRADRIVVRRADEHPVVSDREQAR